MVASQTFRSTEESEDEIIKYGEERGSNIRNLIANKDDEEGLKECIDNKLLEYIEKWIESTNKIVVNKVENILEAISKRYVRQGSKSKFDIQNVSNSNFFSNLNPWLATQYQLVII